MLLSRDHKKYVSKYMFEIFHGIVHVYFICQIECLVNFFTKTSGKITVGLGTINKTLQPPWTRDT